MAKVKFIPTTDRSLRGIVPNEVLDRETELENLNDNQIHKLSQVGYLVELEEPPVEPDPEEPPVDPDPEEPPVDPDPEPPVEPDTASNEPTDEELDNMTDEELEEAISKI